MSTRPLRAAIVGSGPAGFYAAGQLLAADPPVEVDMIERLPTPWGLVRLGVAPDHPNIKAVSRVFEKIAARPGFRFFGNVEIGRDLFHADLMRLYDAVIYAVGAQSDRRMGIPGEDLEGSLPATAFVAWYNGHPDYQGLDPDLSAKRAVVIGNGNVAVDVTRMLALTKEELDPTDTSDAAITALCAAGIEEIVMVGRRGPAQAAFTTPELQELGELGGADVLVDPADLELDPASEASLETNSTAKRNVEILREYATRERSDKPKAVRLRFLWSPVAIGGEERVESIELVRNELSEDGKRAVATDVVETLECGLVLRSVGYRGVPIPDVPFDEQRGTIRNENGRVLDDAGEHIPGLYCTGWIKRGPSGIIGTNKKDATETVTLLLEDAAAGQLGSPETTAPDAVEALLAARGAAPVEYDGWTAIDTHERTAGEPHGRPRVKLCSWDELLAAAQRMADAQA
ncbi:MAG: ferredoxin/flavodoxin---NADP+ reductase [Gaiellaceae bacterium]|nr:ferredoxin/flavodoxin---NADP+ reductase [Gaiellaceae bacterium]